MAESKLVGMSNFSCQPLLDRLTHVATNSGLLNSFTCMSSDEKINLCLSNSEIKYDEKIQININREIYNLLDVLYLASDSHGKSEEIGEELKSKGSKAYLRKKDKDAHKFYTEGLRHAPSNSDVIPLLYSNRSAVLYQMKMYEACLQDIKRAEESGYPAASRYKLVKRKIESLMKLGLRGKALSVLNEMKAVQGGEIPLESESTNSVNEFASSLNLMEDQLKNLPLSDMSEETKTGVDAYCDLFQGESKKVNEMSSALDVRENDAEGRHVVAVTDIPKGSVIFREKPYASILLPEYFTTHCQHCLSPVFNPIPCDNCSDIIWCSEGCKEEGDLYHRYECKILHILIGVGIAHLALRVILVTDWNTCRKVRKESDSSSAPQPLRVFSGSDKESRYWAVYSLLTHFDKAVPEDQFQYALAAIILGKAVLERTDYATEQIKGSDYNKSSDSDILVYLCSLLMHHIAQLVSNAHAVTEIDSSIEDDSENLCSISQRRIASAIYSSASLMNHSCLPVIINSFEYDVLIIHTTKDIKCGEQIYNCYGPQANRQEREERQLSLQRQYFFSCRCPACCQDEYLLREASWSGLICPRCDGVARWTEGPQACESGYMKCIQCHLTRVPPADVIKNCSRVNSFFQEGEAGMSSGDLKVAETKLRKALKIGVKTYIKENQFLNSVRDCLAKVLTSEGKYEEALTELSICMDIVKSRYGEDSVEFGHELVKYRSILNLLQDEVIRKEESDSVSKKIEEIFLTHYGPRWRNYLKLQNI